MSREHKYRAWDKLNNKMHQVSQICFDKNLFSVGGIGPHIITNEGNIILLCDCELLEYTGLKDKNDKEIYEGDILKVQYAFSNKSYNFKVSYDDDNAGFLLKEITKSYGTIEWFDNLSEHEFEVIGNIYENPELLNQ